MTAARTLAALALAFAFIAALTRGLEAVATR